MGKVVTVINSKGGVAKTTTVLECAYHAGHSLSLKTLVIDGDPQSDATIMLTGSQHKPSLFDLLTDESCDIFSLLKPANKAWPNILVLPSDSRLGVVEPHIMSKLNKEQILKNALKPLRDKFDLIFIDLPPTITSLTVNALVASDAYLIPTDMSRYSEAAISKVKQLADHLINTGNNPNLEFLGIVTTSFQKGNALAIRKLLEDLKEEYLEKLLPFKISDTVKIIEAQGKKIPVSALDPENSASLVYKQLTNYIYNGVQI